jgi:hypothetical protein
VAATRTPAEAPSARPPGGAPLADRRSRIRGVCLKGADFVARVVSALAGAFVASGATAATLPEDKAEAMLHSFDGGGVRASGPAFLVRKSLLDKVSLSAQYYVDAMSNASIDVVTTASPFKETRQALTLGADYVVRDASISVSLDRSREPDYNADTAAIDVAQDIFGGMTTVSIGFSRGRDDVGTKTLGFFDQATHWQYRAGVTQILSPRWLASLNVEAVADEGFLGSPYRAARVFGTTVPEKVPRTRSARAVRLGTAADVGSDGTRLALRAEFRHYWDNWGIKAETLELGAARYFGSRWLADVNLRGYSQGKALFYSDDAAVETRYVSRNRQLASFRDAGIGAKLTYTLMPNVKLTGAYEFKQFKFSDFTDVRTGAAYAYRAHVLQLYASATY